MPVIALVTDLIFSTKIGGTARALGKQVRIARTLEALEARLNESEVGGTGTAAPPLVIIDLNAAGVDPVQAVRNAKAHPSGARVVAFLSHVQAELAAEARQAGADQVLARSHFSERLPELLAGA